jgi:carbonic anhydrase/acetyltransferase-like protein (isoleucine patch superfamily)
MIRTFGEYAPRLASGVFVAPSALVLGQVVLGRDASIWYGTVVRGDVNSIQIGPASNIQDRCVVHVTRETHPTRVGQGVTVGHGAIIHGCTIGDHCMVGMGALVMDGAQIGDESLVAAGSLVPPGKVFAPRSLILGSPARIKGQLSDEDVAGIRDSARRYVELAARHRQLDV